MTDEITAELSRFRSLCVISRNSAFTYRGKAVDVRQVGRKLGVRYVLEGSVRRAGEWIRVTAQLIDAITDTHLWAEKYDRVLEDIFAVQEAVVQGIVGAIAPSINAQERAHAQRRRPENLTAYEMALRVYNRAEQATRRSDFTGWDVALAEARQVLLHDPRSALALLLIAWLQVAHLYMFMRDDPTSQARWNEGMEAAGRLVELNPSDATGFAFLGFLLSVAGRGSEALLNAQRAYELNPNDVTSLLVLVQVELTEGLGQAALEHAGLAARLSPRDPFNDAWANAIRAGASFLLRDHARGVDFARLAVAVAPAWSNTHMVLVLTSVGAGDLLTARSALESARRLAPLWVERRLAGDSPYRSADAIRRTALAIRIAAGLEDPSAADALR